MKHAIKLFEAFHLVKNGVLNNCQAKFQYDHKTCGINSDGTTFPVSSSVASDKQDKKFFIFHCPPHYANCSLHLLHDGTPCPDHKKKALFNVRADKLANTGPTRSTRSQTAAANNVHGKSTPADVLKVAGRLLPSDIPSGLSCFPFKMSDGKKSLMACGRTDDGSDKSIVSPNLAQRAVLDSIGRLNKIKSVSLQVALKDADDPQIFSFY